MIIDGKALAEELYGELLKERKKITREIRLGIVVVGTNPVIESFIKRKIHAAERLDVKMIREDVSEKATTKEVVEAVERSVAACDATIAQLPMPKHVDIDRVLAAVPPEKDVDATNPEISDEKRIVYAPVALAIVEMLKRGGVDIKGKHTVVVGAGRLVGKPAASLLRQLGGDVHMVTLERGSLNDLKNADIVVLGTGNPGFVKPEHLKKGVALVDAGTAEMNKKIRGDADPSCAEIASVFTPVPGGVGPVAVAMIFRNLFDLVRRAK